MIFPGFPGVLSFFQVFQVFQVEWEPWMTEPPCLVVFVPKKKPQSIDIAFTIYGESTVNKLATYQM